MQRGRSAFSCWPIRANASKAGGRLVLFTAIVCCVADQRQRAVLCFCSSLSLFCFVHTHRVVPWLRMQAYRTWATVHTNPPIKRDRETAARRQDTGDRDNDNDEHSHGNRTRHAEPSTHRNCNGGDTVADGISPVGFQRQEILRDSPHLQRER